MSDKKVYENVLLANLLEQEEKRNSMLKERFEAALKKLPLGRLYIRSVKRKKSKISQYAYLSSYNAKKGMSESKYIGAKDSKIVEDIKKKLQDRDGLELKLKALFIEKKMIEKAMNEYKRLCK